VDRIRSRALLTDIGLVVLILAGSANAFAGQIAALPVVAALAGAVLVRRRFPVWALAASVAIGTAQVVVGIGASFTNNPLQPTFADAAILVLLGTVAIERPRRVSLVWLAACVLLFGSAVGRWNPGPKVTAHPFDFTIVFATYTLLPVFAWVLGEALGHRRAYLSALEERAVRAEAERDAQAQIAAAAERARIARELHDVIAHNLSVVIAQADGGRYVFDTEPERSRQALAEIGDTGRQALAEMSNLLGVLKAGEQPTYAPAPGVADIAELVAQARQAGTHVSYAVRGAARPVPAGVSLALYRIAQEALTNVRKHAGSGATAEVTLRYGADEAELRIRDNGIGADRQGDREPGHGLAGMRDRVGHYGGTLDAGPCAAGGFAVAARLPLPVRAST
jgi:signal transduction histidine kinase